MASASPEDGRSWATVWKKETGRRLGARWVTGEKKRTNRYFALTNGSVGNFSSNLHRNAVESGVESPRLAVTAQRREWVRFQ
jgi:hypothetical protein